MILPARNCRAGRRTSMTALIHSRSRTRLQILGVGLLAVAATVALSAGPIFSPTGSMALPRSSHTSTLLPNGKVLIAGGFRPDTNLTLSSFELYEAAGG